MGGARSTEHNHRVLGALLLGALGLAALGACSGPSGPSEAEIRGETEARIAHALNVSYQRIRAEADRVDDELDPVPFLAPGEITALRRFLNASHVRRARVLGVWPEDEEALSRLVEEGRLVELEDTTDHWTVRRLGSSAAYVTPGTRDMLTELAERFHARLGAIGVPAYRMEISSVLRTAEDQARLRRRNPNAAAGISSHEFGTTVDVVYSAYAAPVEPLVDPFVPQAPAMEPLAHRLADLMAERVAGRRSGELGAVLGRVLRDMQDEGLVLVTREAQQPVYHLTVAR